MRHEINFYILHTWISYNLLTAETRVRSLASPCEIFGGNSGTERGFSLSTSVFPTVLHICTRKPSGQSPGTLKQCNGLWLLGSIRQKGDFYCCVQAKEYMKSINVQCYSMNGAWSFLLNSAVSIIFSIHSSVQMSCLQTILSVLLNFLTNSFFILHMQFWLYTKNKSQFY